MDYQEMLAAYRRGEGRTFRATKDDVEVFTIKFRNPVEDEDFYLQIDIQERDSTWNNTPLPVHAVDIAGFEFEVVREDIPKYKVFALLHPDGGVSEVLDFWGNSVRSTVKKGVITPGETWARVKESIHPRGPFTLQELYAYGDNEED